jgi:transcriptional regulator with XRE-family HTH domain
MDNEDHYGAFGLEIQQRRAACGMTLEELAERSELSPSFLQELESGEQWPSLSSLVALAQAFKVAPSDLLANVGKEPELNPSLVQMLKSVPSDVLRSFFGTTKRAKETVAPIEPPQTNDP